MNKLVTIYRVESSEMNTASDYVVLSHITHRFPAEAAESYFAHEVAPVRTIRHANGDVSYIAVAQRLLGVLELLDSPLRTEMESLKRKAEEANYTAVSLRTFLYTAREERDRYKHAYTALLQQFQNAPWWRRLWIAITNDL